MSSPISVFESPEQEIRDLKSNIVIVESNSVPTTDSLKKDELGKESKKLKFFPIFNLSVNKIKSAEDKAVKKILDSQNTVNDSKKQKSKESKITKVTSKSFEFPSSNQPVGEKKITKDPKKTVPSVLTKIKNRDYEPSAAVLVDDTKCETSIEERKNSTDVFHHHVKKSVIFLDHSMSNFSNVEKHASEGSICENSNNTNFNNCSRVTFVENDAAIKNCIVSKQPNLNMLNDFESIHQNEKPTFCEEKIITGTPVLKSIRRRNSQNTKGIEFRESNMCIINDSHIDNDEIEVSVLKTVDNLCLSILSNINNVTEESDKNFLNEAATYYIDKEFSLGNSCEKSVQNIANVSKISVTPNICDKILEDDNAQIIPNKNLKLLESEANMSEDSVPRKSKRSRKKLNSFTDCNKPTFADNFVSNVKSVVKSDNFDNNTVCSRIFLGNDCRAEVTDENLSVNNDSSKVCVDEKLAQGAKFKQDEFISQKQTSISQEILNEKPLLSETEASKYLKIFQCTNTASESEASSLQDKTLATSENCSLLLDSPPEQTKKGRKSRKKNKVKNPSIACVENKLFSSRDSKGNEPKTNESVLTVEPGYELSEDKKTLHQNKKQKLVDSDVITVDDILLSDLLLKKRRKKKQENRKKGDVKCNKLQNSLINYFVADSKPKIGKNMCPKFPCDVHNSNSSNKCNNALIGACNVDSAFMSNILSLQNNEETLNSDLNLNKNAFQNSVEVCKSTSMLKSDNALLVSDDAELSREDKQHQHGELNLEIIKGNMLVDSPSKQLKRARGRPRRIIEVNQLKSNKLNDSSTNNFTTGRLVKINNHTQNEGLLNTSNVEINTLSEFSEDIKIISSKIKNTLNDVAPTKSNPEVSEDNMLIDLPPKQLKRGRGRPRKIIEVNEPESSKFNDSSTNDFITDRLLETNNHAQNEGLLNASADVEISALTEFSEVKLISSEMKNTLINVASTKSSSKVAEDNMFINLPQKQLKRRRGRPHKIIKVNKPESNKFNDSSSNNFITDRLREMNNHGPNERLLNASAVVEINTLAEFSENIKLISPKIKGTLSDVAPEKSKRGKKKKSNISTEKALNLDNNILSDGFVKEDIIQVCKVIESAKNLKPEKIHSDSYDGNTDDKISTNNISYSLSSLNDNYSFVSLKKNTNRKNSPNVNALIATVESKNEIALNASGSRRESLRNRGIKSNFNYSELPIYDVKPKRKSEIPDDSELISKFKDAKKSSKNKSNSIIINNLNQSKATEIKMSKNVKKDVKLFPIFAPKSKMNMPENKTEKLNTEDINIKVTKETDFSAKKETDKNKLNEDSTSLRKRKKLLNTQDDDDIKIIESGAKNDTDSDVIVLIDNVSMSGTSIEISRLNDKKATQKTTYGRVLLDEDVTCFPLCSHIKSCDTELSDVKNQFDISEKASDDIVVLPRWKTIIGLIDLQGVENVGSDFHVHSIIKNHPILKNGNIISDEDVLWTDSTLKLSTKEKNNKNTYEEIKTWLLQWKNKFSNESTKSSDSDDDYLPSDSDDDIISNAIVISGAPGTGKTSLVFSVAKELGFKVIEVNASSCRNGRNISNELKEALASYHMESVNLDSVNLEKGFKNVKKKSDNEKRGFNQFFQTENFDDTKKGIELSRKTKTIANFFQTSNKFEKQQKIDLKNIAKKSENEVKVKSGTSDEKSNVNHQKNLCKISGLTIILFDDVDVVFEEDEGFWSTVKSFLRISKKPVILTVGRNLPVVKSILNAYIQVFKMEPSTKEVAVERLKDYCKKHLRDNSKVNLELLTSHNVCDLRRNILTTQFWTQTSKDSKQTADENDCSTLNSLHLSKSLCVNSFISGDVQFSLNHVRKLLFDSVPNSFSNVVLQYLGLGYDILFNNIFSILFNIKPYCSKKLWKNLTLDLQECGSSTQKFSDSEMWKEVCEIFERKKKALKNGSSSHELQIFSNALDDFSFADTLKGLSCHTFECVPISERVKMWTAGLPVCSEKNLLINDSVLNIISLIQVYQLRKLQNATVLNYSDSTDDLQLDLEHPVSHFDQSFYYKTEEDLKLISSALPPMQFLNKTALNLDYLSAIKIMCKNEEYKQLNSGKRSGRRFLHYFDSISFYFDRSTF